MPPRKDRTVSTERIPVVVSAVETTTMERLAAVGLLAFGALPLVIILVRLLTTQSDTATWITLTILGLYAFTVIETISMILLRGFRRIELSDTTMHWLGAMALGEIGPMAWYIIKKVI